MTFSDFSMWRNHCGHHGHATYKWFNKKWNLHDYLSTLLKSIRIRLSGYKSDPFLSFFWSRESRAEFLTPSRKHHKDEVQYCGLTDSSLPAYSTCSSGRWFSPGFVRSKSDSNLQFPAGKHSGVYSHCCSWRRIRELQHRQPMAGFHLARTSCRLQCKGRAGNLFHLVRNIQHGIIESGIEEAN